MSEHPRRLCFMVTSSLTATSFLRGYLGFLRADGWEVVLICSDGKGLADLAASEGIRVHTVKMRREPSPLHDLRSLWATFVLLRRLRPHVLVYATPKASLLGAVAGWFARVPRRVYELWGLRLETADGAERAVLHVLEWVTAKLSTVVIANSRSLADRVTEIGVSAGHSIVVLGAGSSHGVDVNRFRRDAPMPALDQQVKAALNDRDVPVVGFVGRLHADKGIDTLLMALRRCAEVGIRLQALIVGGDEGAHVATHVEQLRKSMPVHLAGYVADPRPYIASMSVLVLPSLREGFPNVVLEAAALEVPAIVSDATGCIDSVEDGVTGVVVPLGDVEALASVLATVPDSGAWRSRGFEARQRVLRDFSAEAVWRAHACVFAGHTRSPTTSGGVQ